MRPNLPALTSLSFFAALWVVFFHESTLSPFRGLDILTSYYEATPWQIFITNGPFAVSFFFVLSGAILTYSYCQPDQTTLRGTPRDFWVSRIARLWPMYLIGLILDAPFFLHALHTFHPALVKFGSYLIADATPVVFMLQAWIPKTLGDWNPPGWSLSTEMFFYALFPLLLVKLSKLATLRLLLVLLITWIASLPASYLLTTTFPVQNISAPIVAFPDPWNFMIDRLPILRLPEFVIGVCIGLFAIRHGSVLSKQGVLAGALPAVALFSLIVLVSCTSPPITTLLLAPLIGAVILSFMLASERSLINRILCNRLLVIGGESSFSLYIIHWPIAKWFIAAETRLGISDGHDVPTHFFSYLALVVIAAYLLCRFVERPAYQWLRKRFIGQKIDQKLIDQSTINPEAQSLSQLS